MLEIQGCSDGNRSDISSLTKRWSSSGVTRRSFLQIGTWGGVGFAGLSLADLLRIQATVRATDRTGVEMEALTAVAVAGLTVYDMCKAIDRSMRMEQIELVEKTGGKSGTWHRPESAAQTDLGSSRRG